MSTRDSSCKRTEGCARSAGGALPVRIQEMETRALRN